MRLPDLALLAGDTLRARAYLAVMAEADILPARVLLLPTPVRGQAPTTQTTLFAASRALADAATAVGIPIVELSSADVNDPAVVAEVEASSEKLLVYAGFAGVLLGRELLGTGRSFLHVHPGWLPDFRGSTTLYYSLLAEGTLGASALLLTAGIDEGPVVARRRYPVPVDRLSLDGEYDAWVRADLLARLLRDLAATGRLEEQGQRPEEGTTFYVIHPVLKHIALLGGPVGTS